MDLWLSRAGIVAEMVSFALVAPEILGTERLRRAEAKLESWAAGQRVWLLTETKSWWSFPLFYLPSVLIASVFVLALLGVIPIWFVIIGLVFGIWALIGMIALELKVQHWLPILPFVVSVVILITVPAFLLGEVGRFLRGDNRLRAFVFGTGVILLFGGLAMQLVATF